jgi:alpha-galactosidase
MAVPVIERREVWAEHVRRCSGLRSTGDRLADLDEWGVEMTRELLASVPAATPFHGW